MKRAYNHDLTMNDLEFDNDKSYNLSVAILKEKNLYIFPGFLCTSFRSWIDFKKSRIDFVTNLLRLDGEW